MDLEVRAYRAADESDVIRIWNESLANPAPHNDPATSLRNKLLHDDGLLLVAAADDRVVGTIMGGYDGHRGWIYSLAVGPAHRRHGIGTMLVRRMEALLQERGCLKLNLQVRTSNAEVIRFYERLGFAVEEILNLGKRLY